jgi:hypothetical protein
MISRRQLLPLFLAAFFAVSAGLRAADAPAKDAAPAKAKADVQPAPADAKKAKTETQPAPADMKKATEQFNAKRDALIAAHAAQLEKLKNATAGERKAILEQMQAQQKDLLEAQRALGKQIRDDLRKLKQSQPPGR